MSIFLRILVGLVLVAIGAFLVIKTHTFMEFFGTSDWAERNLGSSSLLYKLIGIGVCFIGFMVATNLWTAFLNATLGSLLGLNRPGAVAL